MEQQLEEQRRLSSDAQRQLLDKEQELADERRRSSDAQRQLLDKVQELTEERCLLSNAKRQLQDKEQQLEEERRLSSDAQRQLRDKQRQLEDKRDQLTDENHRLKELLDQMLDAHRHVNADPLLFSDQFRQSQLKTRFQRSSSLANEHSSSRQEANLLVNQRRLLEKARSSHHLFTQVREHIRL